jgi:hypothetical protein
MRSRVLVIVTVFLLAAATNAAAQAAAPAGGATRFQATRQELQDALARYDQSARSHAYSPQLRARAR